MQFTIQQIVNGFLFVVNAQGQPPVVTYFPDWESLKAGFNRIEVKPATENQTTQTN